ncbi:hypothetical protein ncot_19270 [Nocardioides sp. JQ2195]|uniref:hypothetical protein n=1 Tax=Nocardioides sp. JQ2195 TaxID=2592334 RepID=UPI00143EED9A|nr:hypothetical protein [Nocardioides sp. JQ2195]QIX28491.1 hypothetical protein ncot_19270 [Nocardioides sp. JQ2195]
MSGTDGVDVIVTQGASEVHAGAGDDLICVTNIADAHNPGRVEILAGAGDDTVDATAARGVVPTAVLGTGEDTYLGGPGRDWVEAAGYWDEPDPAEGHDSILTGDGADYVLTGGTTARPDGDRIDLGAGADEIEVTGALVPAAWTAGSGTDQLTVVRLQPRGTWVFDNSLGRASHDGSLIATWTSLERFELQQARSSRISFHGGSRSEFLSTLVPLDHVALGDGNDVLQLRTDRLRDGTAMRVSGQRGDDLLRLGHGYNQGAVDLDLAAGSLRLTRPGKSGSTSTVRGFERTHVFAMWARVLGTRRNDEIGWNACKGSVKGRGGDDTLAYLRIQENSCGYMGDAADIPIRGGRGDDRLLGGLMPDVLIGGPGSDVARGRRGNDVCRVESSRGCERR